MNLFTKDKPNGRENDLTLKNEYQTILLHGEDSYRL